MNALDKPDHLEGALELHLPHRPRAAGSAGH